MHAAHRGALWAALTASCLAAVIGGFTLESGFGLGIDLAFMFAAVILCLPLVTLGVALSLTLLRNVPRLGAGVAVAVMLLLALPWMNSWGYLFGAAVVLIECTLGASVATALLGGLRYAALGKKTVTMGAGSAAVFANVWLLLFLRDDGLPDPQRRAQAQTSWPPALNLPDPSRPGAYSVQTLFYGHGDDLRRAEFGRGVAIRTATVNGTPFFPDFTGWQARLRKLYWGFGMDRLPLNARVWYPRGEGPFPLVLMAHGNHEMSEFSDPGYAYLGELLASRGFIFVSIDENFLNTGLMHEPPDDQPARAWLMLEHLKLWEEWNRQRGNPFFAKVDVANVALMGHSRGGAAAVRAVEFNKLTYDPDDAGIRFQYGFPIKAVIAIAPAGDSRSLTDVDYLTIQGAHDSDVATFQGSQQWEQIGLSPNLDFFKSELYIYGANHGQFNTVWGRSDARGPRSWFLNLRPLLSGGEQRQIAKVYVAAFLEAALRGQAGYRAMFRDSRRARAWLPETFYFNRYLDGSHQTVAGFNEDSDLTTTTLAGGRIEGSHLSEWREAKIPIRNGERASNGVFLGWTGESAGYSLTLPQTGLTDRDSALVLSVAVTADDPVDFTVALETGSGVEVRLPVSRYRTLEPARPIRFTKAAYLDQLLYKDPVEPVFQTVELPLSDFEAANPRFKAEQVKRIRLRFDRSAPGEILLSQIGFERAAFARIKR